MDYLCSLVRDILYINVGNTRKKLSTQDSVYNSILSLHMGQNGRVHLGLNVSIYNNCGFMVDGGNTMTAIIIKILYKNT